MPRQATAGAKKPDALDMLDDLDMLADDSANTPEEVCSIALLLVFGIVTTFFSLFYCFIFCNARAHFLFNYSFSLLPPSQTPPALRCF